MRFQPFHPGRVLWLSLLTAALAACGSDEGGSSPGNTSGGSSSGGKGGTGASGSSQGGAGNSTGGAGNGGSNTAGTSAGGAGNGGAGDGGAGNSGGSAGSGGAENGGASGTAGSAGDGGTSAGTAGDGGTAGAGAAAGDAGAAGQGSSGAGAGGAVVPGFDVQPAQPQTLQVNIGSKSPTITYAATFDGLPVNAAWGVDQGSVGTVSAGPSNQTEFIPSGNTGGLVHVKAGFNSQSLQREVLVKLSGEQNGADPSNPEQASQVAISPGQLTEGGGVGGVGGEGLGGAILDPGLLASLKNPGGNGSAEGLKFLYPYDKTVWPRGMLAPLLMWDWSVGDADAIQISLSTTTGSFSWSGTFGRPDILQATGGKFIRHPIPQDIWRMATDTAGGPTPDGTPDRLTISLVVAKNGQAYGPISETWTVAPARLSGSIYYNSYGTLLAKNYPGAVGGDGMFGGAVLSIRVGDTAPKLTAGANGGTNQCRVCHSVAARGSRLIAQYGENSNVSRGYDLTPQGSTEFPMANGAVFPAIAPDGSFALSPAGQILALPSSNVTASTGLSGVSSNLGTPAFSPDGKRVVFNPMNSPSIPNPTQKLVVMDFDAATNAFANPVVVADYTGQPAQTRPGWPAFFPDGSSVVFQLQSVAGVDGNGAGDLHTRKGAKAQVAWASASDSSNLTILNALNGLDENGTSYLPKLASPVAMSCTGDGAQVGNIDPDHGDDINLNYEPTVNPVASGGYAWVVFTSRRMYGNEATIPPFCSDPRGVDLVQNITPKKLWVAAVDLNAKPGQDASHPAFYLPAQELLAGNARGFWVLDPCRQDGASCASGDQCCNGYCQPDSGGALVCSNIPPNSQCSNLQEKCLSAADCCDSTNLCINGFCSQGKPLPPCSPRRSGRCATPSSR